MKKVYLYDTLLRDGLQGEGVSMSGPAKIKAAILLDEFGVDYIEGGYAASNPKDMDFFHQIRAKKLKHAKIAAFGSTRRAKTPVGEDAGTQKILEAGTSVATIFGKSWTLHVTDVLRVSEQENLDMIRDTVRYLKEHGKEVIYDAEHFFDGWKCSPEYAAATLKAAAEAGADSLVLCDTNGGALPHEIYDITSEIVKRFDVAIGIHCHNDGGMGVANSVEAVRAGAVHVQGVINGYGERCGNANLCEIAPALEFKLGARTVGPARMKGLCSLSRAIDEILNMRHNKQMPYVGASAFAHKAGMHVNAVQKNPKSFEHVEPGVVGNERRILISELAGGSNILLKAIEMGVNMDKSSPEVRQILNELEQLERKGYEFEAADGSFQILIKKVLKKHKPFFDLEGFRVIIEKRGKDEPCVSEATVKVNVNGEKEHTVGEGEGPVNALDNALRKALANFYPQLAKVILTDYRVRILDPEEATAAKTRVLIESTDGVATWGTVGVSENIIEASWEALVDSMEYKLFADERKKTGVKQASQKAKSKNAGKK